MRKVFKITNRHYKVITKQAADNFPKESGGFLGGKDDMVQAILPIFNQHIGNKTDTFGFIAEDIERAKLFFDKHGLEYYGLYHTHPSGVPIPSKTDINTGHQYHFIIGIPGDDASKAELRAWEVIRKQPHQIPIEIVSDSKVTAIDIHSESAKDYIDNQPAMPKTMFDEAVDLNSKIDSILENETQYERKESLNPYHQDGFSTLA